MMDWTPLSTFRSRYPVNFGEIGGIVIVNCLPSNPSSMDSSVKSSRQGKEKARSRMSEGRVEL
jgi:hypothetical protein